MDMGEYDLHFQPRVTIQSYALVDFVAEWIEAQLRPSVHSREQWDMAFDGSLVLTGAGTGVVLTSPGKQKLKYVLQLCFPTSNNTAEYEVLLHGFRIAVSL